MKRLLCILLCCCLGLSLCACGKTNDPAPAPEAVTDPSLTGNALQDSAAFADAYLTYLNIRNAVVEEVDRRVGESNAVLETSLPDSYYMDPSYLLLVYVPFSTAYPAVVADAILQGEWKDAKLSEEGNLFRSEFTYVDKTSGSSVNRSGLCTWEIAGSGAFRVVMYVDGEVLEFTEFIPQGNDRYLLYTLTDKALVEYKEGQVTGLWHIRRISEPAVDSFPGDLRYFSLDVTDYFPGGTVVPEDFAGDADALYLLTLENDTLTYIGRAAQDQTDEQGRLTGIQWMDIDPVTLLK